MSAVSPDRDGTAAGLFDRLHAATATLLQNQARLSVALENLESSSTKLRSTLHRAQARLEASRLPPRDQDVLTTSTVARLQARLATMPVIEQAKGILVAQTGCPPEDAFDHLRRASQRANVPVRELALRIVQRNVRGPEATARSA